MILQWITNNYGFVLHYGVTSFSDWATQIKEVYSLENEHNQTAYDYLQSNIGIVTKNDDCIISVVK